MRRRSKPATPATSQGTPSQVPAAAPETEQTRKLQQSATRRLWSTLLDYRDWTSYLYVPLLVPILVVLPYFAAKWYHQSQVAQRLIEGIAQSNQDYALMSKLLQGGPMQPFVGMPVEEVPQVEPPDNQGIEVIADMRVVDLRQLRLASSPTTDEQSIAFVYRRVRIQKTEPTANRFHDSLPVADGASRSTHPQQPGSGGYSQKSRLDRLPTARPFTSSKSSSIFRRCPRTRRSTCRSNSCPANRRREPPIQRLSTSMTKRAC